MGPLRSIAPFMLAAAFAPTPTHALLHSRELWATVDVCNPKDQPETVGIRGSMPGDGNAKDAMYMRFRIQYLDTSTNQWIDLGKEADSGFVKIGTAQLARQDGHSFTFASSTSKSAYTLRGEVIFQWRKASTVLLTTVMPTTAGHTSLAGADPKGFSAATCKLT
ncbi:MAG TPA: hypothetical protein VGP18_08245 [Solirubrobacteraceae bacterium]|jgi:hypothetical protein|nr:hypothetical protein [Solirubrobacteraceae bacterium]